MKSIFLTFALGLSALISVQAQNKRIVSGYKHTTTITVTKNECIVDVDNAKKTFAINKGKAGMQLAEKDEKTFVAYLQLDANQKSDLEAHYDSIENNKYKGLRLPNHLINRAIDKGGSMLLQDSIPVKTITGNNGTTPDIGSDDATVTPIPANNGKETSKWPWIAFGVLGGLLGGTLIGKFLFTKKEDTIIDNTVIQQEETTIQPQEITKRDATIAQLRQELDTHKNFDANVYNNMLQKIVQPGSNALQNEDSSAFAQIAIQAWMYIKAITNHKHTKKIMSDTYNLSNLIGQQSKPEDAPEIEINSNTPKDKISSEIKTIINVLDATGNTSLENVAHSKTTIKSF